MRVYVRNMGGTPIILDLAQSSDLAALQAEIDALQVIIQARGQFQGTDTNDNAVAGNVGEYVSSIIVTGSSVALTTAVAADVTSISLTAGDWDVWVNGFFNPAGTTVTTLGIICVSLVSATLDVTIGRVGLLSIPAAGFTGAGSGGNITVNTGPVRFSLASTTTLFFVAQANFTTSTMRAYGGIFARRVR
jgi:hypothetical protein